MKGLNECIVLCKYSIYAFQQVTGFDAFIKKEQQLGRQFKNIVPKFEIRSSHFASIVVSNRLTSLAPVADFFPGDALPVPGLPRSSAVRLFVCRPGLQGAECDSCQIEIT